MRQICPNCLKSIDVPESAAGGEYDCPACGKPFPVPRAYAPAVFATPPGPVVNPSAARTTSADPGLPTVPAAGPVVNRPAPPPGLVPPAPPPPETHTGPEPAGGGPLRHHGFTLDPRVLPWLPVFCLALCLVLSFFPWVGAYPGGYRVFSQTPWEAGVGGLTPVPTAVPQSLQQAEPELKRLTDWNPFMLLYDILLVLALILAVLERVFQTAPTVAGLPGPLAWLPGVWPYRFAVLLGLTGLLLFLVVFQAWRGFGLETAVQQYATSLHAEEVEKAGTIAQKQVAQIAIGMDAARFAVQPATVRDIAVAAHIVALLGVLSHLWLARRGGRPVPRIAIEY